MPGSCCGIVGFKPSRMLTPHGPDASQIWESCCGEFVMTRTIRDSAVMLDCVAGQDIGAYYSAPTFERSFEAELDREPKKLKIAWSAVGPDSYDTHSDCVAAVEHAAQLCSDLGHSVEEAVPTIPDPLSQTLGEAFLNLMRSRPPPTLKHSLNLLVAKHRRRYRASRLVFCPTWTKFFCNRCP